MTEAVVEHGKHMIDELAMLTVCRLADAAEGFGTARIAAEIVEHAQAAWAVGCPATAVAAAAGVSERTVRRWPRPAV